jgi:transposase
MLAKLHRAGELTPIWIPDAAHEAMRDLVRARATAVRVLSKARQHLQGFLLRHDRIYHGARAWTLAYRRCLTTVRFDPSRRIMTAVALLIGSRGIVAAPMADEPGEDARVCLRAQDLFTKEMSPILGGMIGVHFSSDRT